MVGVMEMGFQLPGSTYELEVGGPGFFADEPVDGATRLLTRMSALSAPQLTLEVVGSDYEEEEGWVDVSVNGTIRRLRFPLLAERTEKETLADFFEQLDAALRDAAGRRFILYRAGAQHFRVAWVDAGLLRAHPELELLHSLDVDAMTDDGEPSPAFRTPEDIVGAAQLFSEDGECILGSESYEPLLRAIVGELLVIDRVTVQATSEAPTYRRGRALFAKPLSNWRLEIAVGGRRHEAVVRGDTDWFDDGAVHLLNRALAAASAPARLILLGTRDQSFMVASATREQASELFALLHALPGFDNPWDVSDG